MATTISGLVERAYGHAERSGFHDTSPSTHELATDRGREWASSKLALIHSEVSEALEELRDGQHPATEYHATSGKPESFPSELADVVIRAADLAGAIGIDLEAVIEEKLRYNESRPPKHGKSF